MRSALGSYLKVVDQYFGPEELSVLLLVESVRPDCRVTIVTSKKHQLSQNIQKPWDETYRAHWHVKISDQLPPQTEVLIVGVGPQGRSPMHDRLWITENGALEIGTSYNALGLTQDSHIRVVGREESSLLEMSVDRYITKAERLQLGERIEYNSFTL